MPQHRVFLEPAAKRETVEQREQDVAHHRMRRFLPRQFERLESGVRLEDAMPAGQQQRLDRREVLVTFVGEQYGSHGGAPPPACNNPPHQ